MAKHEWQELEAAWCFVADYGWTKGIVLHPDSRSVGVAVTIERTYLNHRAYLRPRDPAKYGKDKPTAESEARR